MPQVVLKPLLNMCVLVAGDWYIEQKITTFLSKVLNALKLSRLSHSRGDNIYNQQIRRIVGLLLIITYWNVTVYSKRKKCRKKNIVKLHQTKLRLNKFLNIHVTSLDVEMSAHGEIGFTYYGWRLEVVKLIVDKNLMFRCSVDNIFIFISPALNQLQWSVLAASSCIGAFELI